MSSASLRSAQSSASPKRTSSSDCGSIRTPLAPDACRITVSLVESWPSTRHPVERARDAHAEQQVGGLGAQCGIGLDEAEHRRERRRDHPGALGLRGQPHGAGRQRDVDLDLLGELVRGLDRLGEVAVAVLAQLDSRTRDPADRLARRRATRRSRRSRRPRPGPRGRRRPSPPRPASAPPPRSRAGRSPRSRSRSWPPRPGSRPAASVPWSARPGAASTPERVNRAALTQSASEQTSRPRSIPPLGLIPQATPAARKPPGSSPGLSVTCSGTSSQRLTTAPRSPAARTSG